MTNIIILTQDLRQEWLLKLTRVWPNILLALLDQAQGESLERLQLISLELEIIPKAKSLDATNIKRTKNSVDNFLMLESMLSIDENTSVRININYFIRGARKYYKTPLPETLPTASLQVEKIEIVKIKEFFGNLGQENSFFYDQALAELNGHPEIIVPTQAIIAWLVQYALSLGLAEPGNLTFRLNFYLSVYAHQELSLGQELSAEGLRLALFSGEDLAVVLEGFCR